MNQSVGDLFQRYGPGYRWIAAVSVTCGSVGIVLSSSIVNVAIPNVMGTFGVGQDQAQWVATAYLAAQTVSQLITIWAIETLGIQVTYLLTLSVFILGSILGASAPTMDALTLARVLQGMAAGVVLPASMVLMALVFPPERKGLAMGIFSMGTVLAPAVGPVFGGIAIDNYSWRYIFVFPLPLATIALLLGFRFLPGRTEGGRGQRIDWFGILSLALAILCILTMLARGQRVGWGSGDTLIRLGIGILAAWVFVSSQIHSRSPLLDFSVLRNGQFSAACVVAFVFGAGLFSTSYFIPVFVQTVMGYPATEAGFLLAPGGFLLIVLFPLAGRLADAMPAHYLIITGLLSLTLGFLMIAGTDVNTAFWAMVGMTLVSRFGLGLIFPPLNAAALRALPPSQLARASGTISFFRQLGGAFGVSTLVIAIEVRAEMHATALNATQTPDNLTSVELITAVSRLLGEAGIPDALQRSGALGFLGGMIRAQAASLAFQDAAYLICATFVLAIIPAFLLGRRRRALEIESAPAGRSGNPPPDVSTGGKNP